LALRVPISDRAEMISRQRQEGVYLALLMLLSLKRDVCVGAYSLPVLAIER
jgi:hypothetical protein